MTKEEFLAELATGKWRIVHGEAIRTADDNGDCPILFVARKHGLPGPYRNALWQRNAAVLELENATKIVCCADFNSPTEWRLALMKACQLEKETK